MALLEDDLPDNLDEFLNQQYSGISVIKKTISMPLPPSCIAWEEKAIHKMIGRQWLHKYVRELGGFLIDYANLNITSTNGIIVFDMPYVFWKVSANFKIFTPEVGSVLQATIQKFTSSHIYCTVNENMTACLPKPEATVSDIGRYLFLGKTVLIRVEKIDKELRLLRCCIDNDCLALMKKYLKDEHEGGLGYDQTEADQDDFGDFFS